MKEIRLKHADLTTGDDELVPVAMVVDSLPAIAFIPASIAESMEIQARFGTTSTDNAMYKGLLDNYTVVIFDCPNSLMSTCQLSNVLYSKFIHNIERPVMN
jgi:cellulose biosynthesis protein BcsQ